VRARPQLDWVAVELWIRWRGQSQSRSRIGCLGAGRGVPLPTRRAHSARLSTGMCLLPSALRCALFVEVTANHGSPLQVMRRVRGDMCEAVADA